jgi:hypothetical protein
MPNWILQTGAIALILAATFIGPSIAIAFLLRRKRRRRALRRSPLTKNLLRSPGHSVREQLDEATSDLGFDVMGLALFPILVIALYFAQQQALGTRAATLSWLLPIYGGAVAVFIAYQVRKLVRAGHRIDDLRAGYDAELAVGQELDQLMREGARVFHDLKADKFNIDHVVICPSGLFAVETKGFTKPRDIDGRAAATVTFDGKTLKFPTWTTAEPLDQAARQAQWLAKWASSAIGEPVSATAVLALPGWWVERKGRGNTRVISGGEVNSLLSRTSSGLSPQLIQRIAHQIEQRCRIVEPEYRDDIAKV